MVKEKTCCFTGHRIVSNSFDTTLIERGIEYLINHGVDSFICGGALGFDTLCARAVLAARELHPHIKLYIFAPCNNQERLWSKSEQNEYKKILEKADFVDIPNRAYYNGCMKERNYKMVDFSAYCICYLNTPYSGTGQTYRYAQKSGLTVYNLAGRKNE